ncbi:MAG: hypothetical protein Kow0068_17950 [Marinilabiliales bacterium]
MFAYFIIWIIEFFTNKKSINELFCKPFYFIVAFYLVLVIGLFITEKENIYDGLFNLQVKSSLIYMPLLVAGFSDYIKNRIKIILKIFVISALASSLICLIIAFYHWIIYNDHHYIYYGRLSIFNHPTYFALYLNMALVFLISFLKESYKNKKLRNIYFGLIVYLLGFIFLLSSKAGLITALIIIVIYPVLILPDNLKKIKRIYFLLMIILSVTIAFANPRMKSLISHVKQYDENVIKETNESSLVRILIWKASINVIKNNYLIGVGTGDLKATMLNEYIKNGYTGAYEGELNPHNQYLETMVANGLLGIITLIIFIFYPFIQQIKQKKYEAVFFFIIIILNFAFESILDRQSGNMFISLFYSIFVFIKNNDL